MGVGSHRWLAFFTLILLVHGPNQISAQGSSTNIPIDTSVRNITIPTTSSSISLSASATSSVTSLSVNGSQSTNATTFSQSGTPANLPTATYPPGISYNPQASQTPAPSPGGPGAGPNDNQFSAASKLDSLPIYSLLVIVGWWLY